MILAALLGAPHLLAQTNPVISVVANAEGESPVIAPNTWVEIKGSNLAPTADVRTWQTSDFVKNQMPVKLDGVSVTVNGKNAYIYYISPTQVNILTPPDAMTGAVAVVVTNNGSISAAYTAQAQSSSPSFFAINGGTYVVAQHGVDYSLVGPTSLYPGLTTRAKAGETVLLYANGFGPVTPVVANGATVQKGTLPVLPTVTIGGIPAVVTFAGINGAPGLFQFNVVVPADAPTGDNELVATYNGVTSSPMALITIEGSAPSTVSEFYVAPDGNDSWSGILAGPNPGGTDGPFATLDHARAAVQGLSRAGLTQVTVRFRGGTYSLPATEYFTAADSGSANLKIVYENFPGESPVISGGARVQNWTNVSGNIWKTTLPAGAKYSENLFYNGVRRLRPRLDGILGNYYRVANTVYLPGAGPPAAAPDPNCPIYVTGSGWECFDRFQYNPADPIVSTWKNLAPAAGNPCGLPAGNAALAGDIELLIFEKFEAAKMHVSCVDTANHTVYLTGPTVINPGFASALGFIPQHRYLIENIQDQLTQPGQWFLDRSTTPWTVTYLAETGENPNTDVVVLPQLTQVLVASNLQYVTFHGLTFEHDNYTVPAVGEDPDLKLDVSAAVSFQNSQHITFDGGVVAHTSGSGLDFVSCTGTKSPSWCASTNAAAVTSNNVVENSAFYDVGATAVRVGLPGSAEDTDANLPQFTAVQNNVVEGYGRVFPGSYGITQGQAHDNTYTHNDIYDGYRAAVGICYCSGFKPDSHDNVISFNHVYNLLQGIMNDDGSLYIQARNGTGASPTGNKIVNNKVHDVSDASAMDADGYGGEGIYIDTQTGLVDVENNLVYRVSASPMTFAGVPQNPNEANTIKNNIFAFGRTAMVTEANPYTLGVPASLVPMFSLTNNIFYFDRNAASSPSFYLQGGCTYSDGTPFTTWQQWGSNLYWRAGGGFASDTQAFHVQPTVVTQSNLCFGEAAKAKWSFFTFANWQKTGEDVLSVVQDPGFKNPAYPTDDYSLPGGSPGVGFVPFDADLAGRTNPVMHPPAVPATFVTKVFNPAADY
jgi:uncharacterized protein (TIGR03437 family)